MNKMQQDYICIHLNQKNHVFDFGNDHFTSTNLK